MFLFLISVFSIHSTSTPPLLNFGLERQLTNVVGFLILYFFIQLNFDLTSHSFGTRFTSFFNNSFFFFENLFFLGGVLLWILKYYSLFRSKALATIIYTPRPLLIQDSLPFYLRLVPTAFLGLALIISFLPILNYFVWRYF
jgi:hypothetical protein